MRLVPPLPDTLLLLRLVVVRCTVLPAAAVVRVLMLLPRVVRLVLALRLAPLRLLTVLRVARVVPPALRVPDVL